MTMADIINLEEDRFILAHSFRPQFFGTIAFDHVVRQHILMWRKLPTSQENGEQARVPEWIPGKIPLMKILLPSSPTGLRVNLQNMAL